MANQSEECLIRFESSEESSEDEAEGEGGSSHSEDRSTSTEEDSSNSKADSTSAEEDSSSSDSDSSSESEDETPSGSQPIPDYTTLDSSVGQAELTKSLKTGLPITNSPIHSADEEEPAPITLTDSKPVQPIEKNVTTPMSTAESINSAKRPVANTPGDNIETVLATTTVAAGGQQTAQNDVLVISGNVSSKQHSDRTEVALTTAPKGPDGEGESKANASSEILNTTGSNESPDDLLQQSGEVGKMMIGGIYYEGCVTEDGHGMLSAEEEIICGNVASSCGDDVETRESKPRLTDDKRLEVLSTDEKRGNEVIEDSIQKIKDSIVCFDEGDSLIAATWLQGVADDTVAREAQLGVLNDINQFENALFDTQSTTVAAFDTMMGELNEDSSNHESRTSEGECLVPAASEEIEEETICCQVASVCGGRGNPIRDLKMSNVFQEDTTTWMQRGGGKDEDMLIADVDIIWGDVASACGGNVESGGSEQYSEASGSGRLELLTGTRSLGGNCEAVEEEILCSNVESVCGGRDILVDGTKIGSVFSATPYILERADVPIAEEEIICGTFSAACGGDAITGGLREFSEEVFEKKEKDVAQLSESHEEVQEEIIFHKVCGGKDILIDGSKIGGAFSTAPYILKRADAEEKILCGTLSGDYEGDVTTGGLCQFPGTVVEQKIKDGGHLAESQKEVEEEILCLNVASVCGGRDILLGGSTLDGTLSTTPMEDIQKQEGLPIVEEEILCETVASVCGGDAKQLAGVWLAGRKIQEGLDRDKDVLGSKSNKMADDVIVLQDSVINRTLDGRLSPNKLQLYQQMKNAQGRSPDEFVVNPWNSEFLLKSGETPLEASLVVSSQTDVLLQLISVSAGLDEIGSELNDLKRMLKYNQLACTYKLEESKRTNKKVCFSEEIESGEPADDESNQWAIEQMAWIKMIDADDDLQGRDFLKQGSIKCGPRGDSKYNLYGNGSLPKSLKSFHDNAPHRDIYANSKCTSSGCYSGKDSISGGSEWLARKPRDHDDGYCYMCGEFGNDKHRFQIPSILDKQDIPTLRKKEEDFVRSSKVKKWETKVDNFRNLSDKVRPLSGSTTLLSVSGKSSIEPTFRQRSKSFQSKFLTKVRNKRNLESKGING